MVCCQEGKVVSVELTILLELIEMYSEFALQELNTTSTFRLSLVTSEFAFESNRKTETNGSEVP